MGGGKRIGWLKVQMSKEFIGERHWEVNRVGRLERDGRLNIW